MNIREGVEQVVNQIYQRDGHVQPTALVEAAKAKTSPAHDGFEWDNRVAGAEYRLIQARSWIRRVHIMVEDRAERIVHVPRIVVAEDLVEDRQGYYKPLSSLDREEYEVAMKATLAALNSAKAAYKELKEAADLAKRTDGPNFRKADRGFELIDSALALNG